MLTFHIFTIFPEAFESYFNVSILKRSQEKKLIKIRIYNIRDFAKDKHKTVDDKPYGGGPGMVMRIEPIVRAVQFAKSKIKSQISKIILLSPSGKQFNQVIARNLAKKYKDIILICGHYEGIDERIKKLFRISDLSIGPYILSGGELAAMVLVDAVSRHIPGVLGKIESLEEKKGSYPVYTRPEVFSARGGSAFGGEYKPKKYRVPKVLLSGNHKEIAKWRNKHGYKI